jgi:citrate lyase subunit beta/citryl-CoA lyase
MRSKLFVPASRPELFAKAVSSLADGLSFDLEDSVREDKKQEARSTLSSYLGSSELLASKKTIIVRVNPMDSPYFMDDILAVTKTGMHMINLPKIESPQDIDLAVKAISAAEKSNGINLNGASPIRLLINIETPKSLRIAHELAIAHERVAGLQLGLGDLFEPYGIDRKSIAAIEQAMFATAMAAHEGGVVAYDGAFANITDQEGYKAEAQLAKGLGFEGKSCIHPSQIEYANEIFQPSREEIEHALRVLAAESEAQKNSVGAFVVDGKMIDPPFANRARAIVESARNYGLIN